MRMAIVVSSVIIAAALALTPHRAAAEGTQLQICNRSSVELTDVAVGYFSTGTNDTADTLTGPFVSTGWWSIAAGACSSFRNPFGARYMFWWGLQSGVVNSGGNVWTTNGSAHFCIPNVYGPGGSVPSFTYEDENESEAACESGYSTDPKLGHNIWVPVRKVDLDVDATVNFEGT
jgi:uncharacterized membrane protein